MHLINVVYILALYQTFGNATIKNDSKGSEVLPAGQNKTFTYVGQALPVGTSNSGSHN